MSNTTDFSRYNPHERKKYAPKYKTEVKNYVDKMLVCGIPITKKNIHLSMKVSTSYLNSPDLDEYIKSAAKRQEEARIHLEQQNSLLYNKLMASYIFQYSLLDEQEELLKHSIRIMSEQLEYLQNQNTKPEK